MRVRACVLFVCFCFFLFNGNLHKCFYFKNDLRIYPAVSKNMEEGPEIQNVKEIPILHTANTIGLHFHHTNVYERK